MTQYFHEIVGSEMDGKRTGKSEVIEETIRRLGMENHREQILMIGDREHDVFGARKSGLDCLAVSYGYGSMEELEAAEPLKIVSSPQEILDFSSDPSAQTEHPSEGVEGMLPYRNPFCSFTDCGRTGFGAAFEKIRTDCSRR